MSGEEKIISRKIITGHNYNGKIGGDYQQNQGSNTQVNASNASQVTINHNYTLEKTDDKSNCNSKSLKKKQNQPDKFQAILVLTGTLFANNPAKLKEKEIEVEAIIAHLEEHYGLKGKLTIKYLKNGSIKFGLQGSQEDLEKLQKLE